MEADTAVLQKPQKNVPVVRHMDSKPMAAPAMVRASASASGQVKAKVKAKVKAVEVAIARRVTNRHSL